MHILIIYASNEIATLYLWPRIFGERHLEHGNSVGFSRSLLCWSRWHWGVVDVSHCSVQLCLAIFWKACAQICCFHGWPCVLVIESDSARRFAVALVSDNSHSFSAALAFLELLLPTRLIRECLVPLILRPPYTQIQYICMIVCLDCLGCFFRCFDNRTFRLGAFLILAPDDLVIPWELVAAGVVGQCLFNAVETRELGSQTIAPNQSVACAT